MADDSIVRITQWPEGPAQLLHSFNPAHPASVNISTPKDNPVQVEMVMMLASREPVKLCISVCEPICAQSEYTIGIDVFDRPVAAITIRGTTKVFNCADKNR